MTETKKPSLRKPKKKLGLSAEKTVSEPVKMISNECGMCTNGWSGAGCPTCPLYGQKHFIHTGGPSATDCFIVCESPTVGPSADVYKHVGWSSGLEKNVKILLNDYRNKNPAYQRIEMYFSYAVHCEIEKPPAIAVEKCADILEGQLVRCTPEGRPIIILAFGPQVLRSLGVKFQKHADVVGKFHPVTIRGRSAYVFATISLKQMAVKAGYIDIVTQHINTFMQQVLLSKAGKHPTLQANVSSVTDKYVFPKTVKEVEDLVDKILAYTPKGMSPGRQLLAIDTETNTLYPHRKKLKLLTVTVAWDAGCAASIPVEHAESPLSLESIRDPLTRLFNSENPKVGQNVKYDFKVLRRKGFKLENIMWDTLVCEHILAEDKKGFYGLKELTRAYLPAYGNYEADVKAHNKEVMADAKKKAKDSGEKLSKAEQLLLEDDGYASIPLDVLSKYGAIDADVTWQIAVRQRKAMQVETERFVKARAPFSNHPNESLRKKGEVIWTNENPTVVIGRGPSWDPLIRLATTRAMPTLTTLARMEDRGVCIDRPYTQELAIKMEKSSRESIINLNSMLPKGYVDAFNPASAPQIRQILYNTGYIHPETGKLVCYEGIEEPPKTEKGVISTNAKFLKLLTLKHKCPFARTLLEFRAMQKARNTFIENIMVLTREDDRMHTHYHQHGTSSGRLCVSGNTYLSTDKGSFRISELKLELSPSIMTHTGILRRIEGLFYKGEEEMFKVTLFNGNTITCTKGHRFLTPKRGFRQLKDLKVGSQVLTCDLECWGVAHIKSIESVGEQGVWDIQVAVDHSYVAHGFVNHNSSSHENMQNIPKKIGIHNIKKIFIPSHPSLAFVNTDAKAAEVRIYAAYSHDKNLIQALNDGLDPHSFVASLVYAPANILKGIPPERWKHTLSTVGTDDEHAWTYEDFCNRDVYKDAGEKSPEGKESSLFKYGAKLDYLRSVIKRVVFGILYGATPSKVSSVVSIPDDQAQVIVDTLFNMFPAMKSYIQDTKDQLNAFGFVETFIGRRRRFNNLRSLPFFMRNKAERQSINFKIQSTSSDIVMDVLHHMESPLHNDLRGELLLTVHDSIGFECPKNYVSQLPDFIKKYGVDYVSDRYPWLPVPFQWDVEVGNSYGELMSVPNYLKTIEDVQFLAPVNPEDCNDFIEVEIREDLDADLGLLDVG
jgi:DNA polymerase I-like protein with 3'-5' exonuclease and polymerase domains/uracil-DNA glycosylase